MLDSYCSTTSACFNSLVFLWHWIFNNIQCCACCPVFFYISKIHMSFEAHSCALKGNTNALLCCWRPSFLPAESVSLKAFYLRLFQGIAKALPHPHNYLVYIKMNVSLKIKRLLRYLLCFRTSKIIEIGNS